eukprot:COSAG01_NODE_493_length_16327_cov_5.632879_13_plen_95_part_00
MAAGLDAPIREALNTADVRGRTPDDTRPGAPGSGAGPARRSVRTMRPACKEGWCPRGRAVLEAKIAQCITVYRPCAGRTCRKDSTLSHEEAVIE